MKAIQWKASNFFPISWLLLTGDNMKIQTDMQMLRMLYKSVRIMQ